MYNQPLINKNVKNINMYKFSIDMEIINQIPIKDQVLVKMFQLKYIILFLKLDKELLKQVTYKYYGI